MCAHQEMQGVIEGEGVGVVQKIGPFVLSLMINVEQEHIAKSPPSSFLPYLLSKAPSKSQFFKTFFISQRTKPGSKMVEAHHQHIKVDLIMQ